MKLLDVHFPLVVKALDADGIERRVNTLGDLVDLVKEKAERYNDEVSVNYLASVKELSRAEAKTIAKHAPAEKAANKPAAKGKGKK